MADRSFTATATPPEPPVSSGRCRIDDWSPQGWRPLAGFANHADAEAMLADLHRREPQTLFRLVRRIDPGEAEADAPHAAIRPLRAPEPPNWAAPRAAATGRRLAQLAGTVGLIALVALICAARWSVPADPGLTPRSAAGLSAAGGDAFALQPDGVPAIDALPSAAPQALAGRWSASGGDCAQGEIRFMSDHELRIGPDGSRRSFAVTGYAVEAGGTVRVAYAGGAVAAYAAGPERLTLERARIAQIDIDPQLPLVLERCAGPAPHRPLSALQPMDGAGQLANTAGTAFRLAVEVGDDLAATLALARGMPATRPLDAPGAPTPLDWAVTHGRAVLVGKLVAAGADPDGADPGGVTLLSRAVQHGDVPVVEALVAAGADPTLPDRDGRRPLEIADAIGHQLLVDILFAARR